VIPTAGPHAAANPVLTELIASADVMLGETLIGQRPGRLIGQLHRLAAFSERDAGRRARWSRDGADAVSACSDGDDIRADVPGEVSPFGWTRRA